tara:strand:- start:287 stop:538 length:252 start_codon:yes stop_codon:yes gene_type:complete
MSTEQKRFEEWWDAEDDIPNNGPWTHDTPIQFAWAGWQAAPQRTWVGLEKSDMPDGADPLFDDPKFIAGMVYAAHKLMEKNNG